MDSKDSYLKLIHLYIKINRKITREMKHHKSSRNKTIVKNTSVSIINCVES